MMRKPQHLFVCCCVVLLAACSEPNQSDQALRNHTVQVGNQQLDFEKQMLYLTLALEIYRLHIGSYPTNENNLDALISKPEILEGTGTWIGPYAQTTALFIDPWGNRLHYSLTDSKKVDLRSLGADGIPSDDDMVAAEMFPDVYREIEKLPSIGPIPIQSKSMQPSQ